MNTFSISPLPAFIIALMATSAAAQTTTDEARALAAQATAEQQREASARPPAVDAVAAGDYRAHAHQRERVQQWQATQRAAHAYAAGVRSQPLAVNSEDSARAEAQRVHAEQALAERAGTLRSAAAAR
jgi:hypothetical protein